METCRACLAEDSESKGVKSGWALHSCRECGTLFASLPPDTGSFTEIYEPSYVNSTFETAPAVAQSLSAVVRDLARFRETGRWLDVGYGEGALLSIAALSGWQPFGTELSSAALRHGRNSGWTVTTDMMNDPAFPDNGFDVLSMIELIEHVPDPEKTLRTAYQKLRPGGALYLTTPNGDSLNHRLLGVKWSVVAPPEHLTIWSAAGIRSVLLRAGFAEVGVRTQGLNPVELLARLRREQKNVSANERVQTGARLNQTLSSSPLRRRVKRTVNSVLNLMRLGDNLKVRAIKPL